MKITLPIYNSYSEEKVERGTETDFKQLDFSTDCVWMGMHKKDTKSIAEIYDMEEKEVIRRINHSLGVLNTILPCIQVTETEKMLDIGCGPGKILMALEKFGLIKSVIATDAVFYQLKKLRDNIQKHCKCDLSGYVNLLADNLPFKKGSFDVIFALNVLEHLYPYESISLLREIRRLLNREKGRVYIETPNGLRVSKKLKRKEDGSINIPEFEGNWQHLNEMSLGYLIKIMVKAGLGCKIHSHSGVLVVEGKVV